MNFLCPTKNLWKYAIPAVLLLALCASTVRCSAKITDDDKTASPATQSGSESSASLASLRTETTDFLHAGKAEEAIERCRTLSEELANVDGIPSLCHGVITKAVSQWEAQLKTLRDTGNGDHINSATSCAALQREASRVSQERADSIADLCNELAISGRIVGVHDALKQALESSRPAIPPSCDTVAKALMKLGTVYAKTQEKRLSTACFSTFPRSAVDKLSAALKSDRNVGATVDVIQRCFDLKQLAARLSAEDEKRATDLCAAIQASGKVANAIREATQHLKNGVHRVPRSCSLALMALTGLSTDDARSQRSRVVKACYEDLGLAILKAKVPAMAFGCDPNVLQVVRGVQNHRARSPELDEWVAKALPRCGQR
jgi:hypothetical protein